MKKKWNHNIMKNISLAVLILSSFGFGVVAKIIANYSGSYFYIMFTSVWNFVITSTPIILILLSAGYLAYILNR